MVYYDIVCLRIILRLSEVSEDKRSVEMSTCGTRELLEVSGAHTYCYGGCGDTGGLYSPFCWVLLPNFNGV